MDFVNNNCNSIAGTTRIAVKPRQSLPAETEVQAGIEVQSPKCVGPDRYRGAQAGLGTDSLAPIFFRGAAKCFPL